MAELKIVSEPTFELKLSLKEARLIRALLNLTHGDSHAEEISGDLFGLFDVFPETYVEVNDVDTVDISNLKLDD